MAGKVIAIWTVRDGKGWWRVLGGNTIPGSSPNFQIVCKSRNWRGKLKPFLDCMVDIDRNKPEHDGMFTIEEIT